MFRVKRPALGAALAAGLALTATSCSDGAQEDPHGHESGAEATAPAGHPTGPDGDDFFRPPEGPGDAEAGDVIWYREVAEPPEESQGYDLLYWSEAVDGSLVPSSAVVFWPSHPEPGPHPVVAWAHGTAGMGDECAPSKWDFDPDDHGMAEQVAEQTVGGGAVFVASDYQGLGTPGDHPYIVGQAAGHDLLNSIRAAVELSGITSSGSVVLGESQGGAASLFAAELAPTYAPDVDLKGAVAVAPPSNLSELAGRLDGGPYFGFLLMAVAGIGTAYPDAGTAGDQLTPAGREALADVGDQCSDVTLSTYAGMRQADLGLEEVIRSPGFQARLRDSEPGHRGTSIPILLVHGESDDTIPVDDTRELVDEYCAEGVSVTSMFLPGRGHADALPTATPDIVAYLTARLVGEPEPAASCG